MNDKELLDSLSQRHTNAIQKMERYMDLTPMERETLKLELKNLMYAWDQLSKATDNIKKKLSDA